MDLKRSRVEATAVDAVQEFSKRIGPGQYVDLDEELAPGVTVHGFRSTFRDWAGDGTSHPREVIEAALAHVVGDRTEAAYRRNDALEKRRALMGEWAGYLIQPVT